ncbi:MAG: PD-(D/E)XK nuclease family protein [Bacteroidales bacterium]|nr:PD-(D/E)XK nuclease family protein [Bacteroidales bacterium]MBN2697889.1 PD-(D/E)XK nuclease family protein [Bacteroidales bacterium]
MKPFLESLADYVIGTCGTGMGELCIVFPNKRSGLFFRHYLLERTEQTVWAPEITTINDFMNRLSRLRPADPLEVIFELYDIYKTTVQNPGDFDSFYYWGEMMINDFDDIDKYLVDAEQLYSNISDIREIDARFGGLEEDQIAFVRQFWETFNSGGTTSEKSMFLDLWKILAVLYKKLVGTLEKKGIGYEGMIYRQVAENFLSDAIQRMGSGPVIFAGFNALNSCEKRVFNHLRESGKGLFFWDYDRKYVDEAFWEAGRFIRENLKVYKPPVELEDFRNLNRLIQIRIFDLPDDVLQAKMITSILSNDFPPGFSNPADTALVLCDEELLVPVMMSLPHNTDEVNITMGYPFRNTPAFGFVDQLLNMQMNMQDQEQRGFHYRDVMGLLNHPFMRSLTGIGESVLAEIIIRDNLTSIDESEVSGEVEKQIFRRMDRVEDFFPYLNNLSELILSKLNDTEEDFRVSLDREYILQFILMLNRMEKLISGRRDLNVKTFIRLFKKILSGLRIPFSGEPLAGLQIMGILETRLLDFKNLLFLSMNEEIMPRGHSPMSFIPYSLRIAFSMPTREDRDAIYAYYFYRLIQRADRVELLYNSNTEGVRNGEMSRYLYQLKFEHNLETIRPTLEIKSSEPSAIAIEKDPVVMQQLGLYCDPGSGVYLSPSALNTYIDCSLKFYFKYIAGITEKKEVAESLEPTDFGTIIHETIRILYTDILESVSRRIDVASLQDLLKNGTPERVLKEVTRKVFLRGRSGKELTGRNIIIFRVMLKYLLKIIEKDIEVAPFELVSMEEFFSREVELPASGKGGTVRIGGRIDRIDRVKDVLRVIDYKTGSASLSIPSVEELFERGSGSRNRAGFQTLLYAWLVGAKYPGEPVMPGLYVMKQLFSEGFSPGFTTGRRNDKKALSSFVEVEGLFLSNLIGILEALFSEELPFIQTENRDLCRNCDYQNICLKNQFS